MPSSYTDLLFHVVFSTKGRRPAIHPTFRTSLYEYIGGIVRGKQGVAFDIGGISDHIHLAIRIKPEHSVAEIVREIKANSSKWLNEQHASESWPGWQNGYGAFSVSESQLPVVRNYIQNQEEHHRTVSFQDEFILLLQKHGIHYDPTYLWD